MFRFAFCHASPFETSGENSFVAAPADSVALPMHRCRRDGTPTRMSIPLQHEADIDKIASVMAAGAGVVWDRLDHYPGYLRGYWRSEARTLLARLASGDLPKVA